MKLLTLTKFDHNYQCGRGVIKIAEDKIISIERSATQPPYTIIHTIEGDIHVTETPEKIELDSGGSGEIFK